TLRIWEQRYGILIPERTETKIRTYTDEELVLLLNIRILLDSGLKISRIAEFSKKEIALKVAEFKLKTPKGIAQEKLILALIEMDEVMFDSVLEEVIRSSSLAEAFSECLIPFFERIGVMWLTSTINPAQEHFISNLIRQKIIVEIARLPIPEKKDAPVLLYLPEHEWHEIGLLFYQYILRTNGIYTFYLGQSLPYDALVLSIEKTKPACLVTSWLTSIEGAFAQRYFNQLKTQFPDLRVLAGGAQIGIHQALLVNKITHVKSSKDLVQLITEPHLQSSPEQQ
ncbi:MAG: MerR family transcriptional regulator, partial [Flavobacteriales bacterium]